MDESQLQASYYQSEEDMPRGGRSVSLQSSENAKKAGKLSTLTKIFKPWKWRRKKRSEKIEEVARVIEPQLNNRSERSALVQRGVIKEVPSTYNGLPHSSAEMNSQSK